MAQKVHRLVSSAGPVLWITFPEHTSNTPLGGPRGSMGPPVFCVMVERAGGPVSVLCVSERAFGCHTPSIAAPKPAAVSSISKSSLCLLVLPSMQFYSVSSPPSCHRCLAPLFLTCMAHPYPSLHSSSLQCQCSVHMKTQGEHMSQRLRGAPPLSRPQPPATVSRGC